jgi:hypothetical protein
LRPSQAMERETASRTEKGMADVIHVVKTRARQLHRSAVSNQTLALDQRQ